MKVLGFHKHGGPSIQGVFMNQVFENHQGGAKGVRRPNADRPCYLHRPEVLTGPD